MASCWKIRQHFKFKDGKVFEPGHETRRLSDLVENAKIVLPQLKKSMVEY